MSSVPVPWPTTTALPASVTGANDCQSDQITTPVFSHFHMTSLSCLRVVGLGGGGTHWIMARVELEMARLASDPRTASAVAVLDYPVGVNMCHALLVDTPSHCVQLEVAMHPRTACTVLFNATLALHNVARCCDLTPISHTPCSHPRPQVMATVRASEGSRVQSSISGPTNSRGVLCRLITSAR